MTPLFAFVTSPLGWLVIGLIALLVFGNRMPSAMRNLGRGITEFKKGMEGIGDDHDKSGEPKKIEEPKADPPADKV
jgi:sec-independent protein translocase protein TatA